MHLLRRSCRVEGRNGPGGAALTPHPGVRSALRFLVDSHVQGDIRAIWYFPTVPSTPDLLHRRLDLCRTSSGIRPFTLIPGRFHFGGNSPSDQARAQAQAQAQAHAVASASRVTAPATRPAVGPPNELERELSSRSTVRVSGTADTGYDDEFDATAGMITDGFRPSTQARPSTAALHSPNFIGSLPTEVTPVSQPTSPPPKNTRFSTAKLPRTQDSLALRHDGGGPVEERTTVTRASSVSVDSAAFINTETPYEGPSGPSYPYQMYPQDVRLVRTLSVATSSAEPAPESPFTGPRGPTHPYGLFSQGTAAVSGDATVPAISVGFSGALDQYQRRLGPDGEEVADLIGPDGHTEQLPPYTRYPDEVFVRKVRDVEERDAAAASTVAAATSPPLLDTATAAIPTGAGGLGRATRNPEFDPTEEIRLLQSRQSARSNSSGASHHNVNMAASGMTEKGRSMKKWQSRMNRKLCGIIPYWAICMAVALALLIAVILGGVIGAFLLKHKRPSFHGDGDSPPQSTPTVTITYDATPISIPTNLPSLATGTWGMPLMTEQEPNTCFTQTTQSRAWDCNLILSGMQITVDVIPGGDGAHGPYTPPVFNQSKPLELVNDTRDPSRGPAWFWMMSFTKEVIVPESFLTPIDSSSDKVRKAALPAYESMGSLRRKGVARIGDKPWICTWPHTFLELFIYATQNSSWYRPPPVSSAASSVMTTSTTSARPSIGRSNHGGYEEAMSEQASGSTPTMPVPSSSASGPFGPIDTGNTSPPLLPGYPKVVKVEERRVANAPSPPVCAQVEIGEPGTPAKPVLDSNGNPVTIIIVETEPPPPGFLQRRLTSGQDSVGHMLHDRDSDSDLSKCGCSLGTEGGGFFYYILPFLFLPIIYISSSSSNNNSSSSSNNNSDSSSSISSTSSNNDAYIYTKDKGSNTLNILIIDTLNKYLA
ncbi:hypothetical protein P8C59_003296 [Phyllachora maydis]|uniref:DUF7820 domain-containing protein n=1 Tax=Phyllachora maydis TaxID=1825666 RepID=A0AAD9I062_9PEZI|nr:hypothetical protein P8C59_003296 [Phyllachora maydis]